MKKLTALKLLQLIGSLLLLSIQIKAQNRQPLNKEAKVFDEIDLLFSHNHISILITPSHYGKVNIKKQQGNHELTSEKQIGVTAGFMHYTNFSKSYSFIKGLHVSIAGRDEVYRIPVNTDHFELFEDGKPSQEYDLVHVSVPLWIEKRWFNNTGRFLNCFAGINLRYSLTSSEEEMESFYGNSNGTNTKFHSWLLNLNNEGKPWINYNLGGGYSWILSNNNILQTNILINYSNTKFVDGTYQFTLPNEPITEGTYSIKGSFIGISCNYIFTKNKKSKENN